MQSVSDDDVWKRLVEKPRFELAAKGVFRIQTVGLYTWRTICPWHQLSTASRHRYISLVVFVNKVPIGTVRAFRRRGYSDLCCYSARL